MTTNTPNRTGRHVAAWEYAPPRTRPPRPVPVDVAAIDEFNAGVTKARRDYYGDPIADDYARRTAASEKQMRYQRRKAGK